MHCFYCAEIGGRGSLFELGANEAKHLFKTLRGAPGEIVGLIDGCGIIARAVIRPGRTLEVVEVSEFAEPENKVHLFVAPPRKQKMDALLKQCAEIGVWSIQPIVTERSVSVPEKESVVERWDTLLLEGCKQSGNPFMPEIKPVVPLKSALQMIEPEKVIPFYGATVREGAETAVNCCGLREVAWFVGPEGGFAPDELTMLREAGARPLSLGPWVMRVETAVAAGTAILLYELNKLHCKP